MAGEANDLFTNLPPWAQWAANAGVFVVTTCVAIYGFVKRKVPIAEAESREYLVGAEELTDSKVVRKLVTTFDKVAESAQETARAATRIAEILEKQAEDDAIEREVERRLRERQQHEHR